MPELEEKTHWILSAIVEVLDGCLCNRSNVVPDSSGESHKGLVL